MRPHSLLWPGESPDSFDCLDSPDSHGSHNSLASPNSPESPDSCYSINTVVYHTIQYQTIKTKKLCNEERQKK